MFTGIVEEVGKVTINGRGKLVVTADKVIKGLELGGSISVNGVCLTVTKFDVKSFSVDVIPETLKRTNLGWLKVGDTVNLERPLTLGKLLGGHLVQGHIDCTGKLTSIMRGSDEIIMRFEASSEVMRYIVEKGFIAIDGISLTVANLDDVSFQVSVVDYTWGNTVLGNRKVGDLVNLEVDIIAKYVERLNQPQHSGVTAEFLSEHGFSVS